MKKKVKEYLEKGLFFSADGELYQKVDGVSKKGTRSIADRWKAYEIDPSDLKGKNIVDIGCNIGGFSKQCESTCQSYLGIDVDEDAIKLARYLFPFSNCSFETGKFEELYGTFDTILALAVRRYTKLSFEDFAKACHSLLTKNGKMYFESHGREKWTPTTCMAFEKFFKIHRVVYVPATSLPECDQQRFFLELTKK